MAFNRKDVRGAVRGIGVEILVLLTLTGVGVLVAFVALWLT